MIVSISFLRFSVSRLTRPRLSYIIGIRKRMSTGNPEKYFGRVSAGFSGVLPAGPGPAVSSRLMPIDGG
jgi:hypothetical protein